MRFIDIYGKRNSPNTYKVLYRLLQEREPEEHISHKSMPTYEDHVIFVASKPYKIWNLIAVDNINIASSLCSGIVGAIYLTHKDEIGVSIFKEHRKNGYATWALNCISYLEKPLYANINPANQKSINFFERAGFKHIQNTYKLG